MKINDLFYIDKNLEIKTAPYRRDRAMSTKPQFYETRQAAVLAQAQMLLDRSQSDTAKLAGALEELSK